MKRPLTLSVALLFPLLAQAQGSGQMNHSQMNHDAMMLTSAAGEVTEGGQGAFAAIAEVVALLDADPATDWSRVDIEGLRQHLIDMGNVTMRAQGCQAALRHGGDVYRHFNRSCGDDLDTPDDHGTYCHDGRDQ